METALKYFEDTYLFKYESILLDTITSDDFLDKKILVLSETIFYLQGGGQSSDVGTISSMDQKVIFEVEKKYLIKTVRFGILATI